MCKTFVVRLIGDSSNNDTQTASLTINYALDEWTLTSVTSSLQYDYHEICDCDFTSANLFFVESTEDYEQFSQELRFTSPTDGQFEWIGGVYYQTTELDFTDRFFTQPTSSIGNLLDSVLPALFGTAYPASTGQQTNGVAVPRTFTQDSDLYSAFIQSTWKINDVSRLTLGGRYSNEEKSAARTLTFSDLDGVELPYDELFIPGTNMGVDYLFGQVLKAARHSLQGEREESKFAPSVTYEYDVNDEAMVYLSWAKGFKSGGYDVRSNVSPNGYSVSNPFDAQLSFQLDPGSFEYQEEQATTVEFGLKSTLLDGQMELNLAAFTTDYEDLQVSIFDGTLGFNVRNAGEARVQGIEIDGRVAISRELSLTGSLAWLDFEFTDFPDGQCTQSERLATGESLCDYQGKTNQYVADFSGFIAANYEREIGDDLMLAVTADALFTTDYNPSQNLDPNVEQDGYVKFNLRVALSGVETDSWELAVLGKNLTDEKIVTYANDTPLATSLAQSVGYYGFVEPPRTVAVQGTYRF